MIIDDKSFLDLAIHMRHASSELVSAAQRLSRLCDPSVGGADEKKELLGTLDSLVSMNREFTRAERLMRAVWDANHDGPVPLA